MAQEDGQRDSNTKTRSRMNSDEAILPPLYQLTNLLQDSHQTRPNHVSSQNDFCQNLEVSTLVVPPIKRAIFVVSKGPLTPTTGPNLARDPAANKGQSIRVVEDPLTPYSASILMPKNYTIQWLPGTGRIDNPAIGTPTNKITVMKIHGLIMFTMIAPSDHSRQPAAFNMHKLSHLAYPTYHSDNMTIGIQFCFLDEECVQNWTYSSNKRAFHLTKPVLQLVIDRIRKKLSTFWQQIEYSKKLALRYKHDHLRAMCTTKVETSNTEVKPGTYTLIKPCNKLSWAGGPETMTRKEFPHGGTTNRATFEQGNYNVGLEPSCEECIHISPKHFPWNYPLIGKHCIPQDRAVHEIQEELDLNEDEEVNGQCLLALVACMTQDNSKETSSAMKDDGSMPDGTMPKMHKAFDQVEALQDTTSHQVHTIHLNERRISSHELTLATEILERIRTKTMVQFGDFQPTNKLSVARLTSGYDEVAMQQFGRVIFAASALDFNPGIEITVAYMMQFFHFSHPF